MKRHCYLLLWVALLIPAVLVAQGREALTEGYDLCFFPEGGHLIPGERCIVAFQNLSDQEINGYVMDENGDSITSLSFHNQKCGLFQFIPEMGKKYFAAYCGEDQVWKRAELPPADSDAYALQVHQTESKVFITWHTAKENPVGKEPFTLRVYSGDHVYYDQAWDSSKECIALNKKDILSGVMQITLLDAEMNSLSERPFLCVNDHQVKASYTVDKAPRDKKARLKLKLALNSEEALAGRFSVYVTQDSARESHLLYAVYPSEDLNKSLKYLSPEFLEQIRNIRYFDAYVLSDNPIEEMGTVHLQEVSVKASPIVRPTQTMYELVADYKLTAHEIERMNPFNLESLIRRIPGLIIRNGQILLVRNMGRVAIHLDGTEIISSGGGTDILNQPKISMSAGDAFQESVLSVLNIEDIRDIQLIKGAGRALFGMKGFGGILSITTKKGNENYIPPAKEVKKLASQPKDSSAKDVYYVNWQLDTSDKGELILDMDAEKATGKFNVSISGYTTEGVLVCGSVLVSL